MLANKTVGAKFTYAGALVLVLTMAVGLVAERAISNLSDSVALIIHDPLPGIDSISEIYGVTLEYRGDLWRHIATTDKSTQATLDQKLAGVQQRLEAAIAKYQATITTEEDRAGFEKSKSLIREYMRVAGASLPLSREGHSAEAADLYVKQASASYDSMKTNLLAMIQLNRKQGDEDGAAANSTASKAGATLWILLLVCLGAGGAFLFLILRSLNRDLREAAGKLSGGAVRLGDSAAQITSSSQTLAQGASEQAASLEETSASMEEINSMAKRNADNSRSAADLVNSSVDRFGDANHLLERMENAMGEIHASSGKISKIIKTIDEIAFQTNILALNAAVEAARAGEAGMGFAVVADEVRNLAQRSAQAARDTASLIEESIEKSNGGKAMVEQVAEAIRSITGEISKVKTLVDEVSLGSQEQTTGIDQISRAIGEMERVTQRSAAGAEQSASAAAELKSETGNLKTVVEDLEAMVGVGEGRAAVMSVAAPAPPRTVRNAPPARSPSGATSSAPPRKLEQPPAGFEALNRDAAPPPPKGGARRQAVNAFPLDDSEFEHM